MLIHCRSAVLALALLASAGCLATEEQPEVSSFAGDGAAAGYVVPRETLEGGASGLRLTKRTVVAAATDDWGVFEVIATPEREGSYYLTCEAIQFGAEVSGQVEFKTRNGPLVRDFNGAIGFRTGEGRGRIRVRFLSSKPNTEVKVALYSE